MGDDDECPKYECRFSPYTHLQMSKECRTATDWAYNFICNDDDYNLFSECDGKYLTLKCVNKQGDETYNFRYYDPDEKIQDLKDEARKNKEEIEKLRGKFKPKKSKRKQKKSKRKRKKSKRKPKKN